LRSLLKFGVQVKHSWPETQIGKVVEGRALVKIYVSFIIEETESNFIDPTLSFSLTMT